MDKLLFESVIYGNPVLIIVRFLDPKDIVSMCRAFKKIRHNLYRQYEKAVMGRIDDWFRVYYGPEYDKFREVMIADKAVLSGSFIIQMMFGERWKDADIDIFISVEDFKDNRQFPDNNGYKYYSEVEQFIYNEPNLTQDERFKLIVLRSRTMLQYTTPFIHII